MEEDQILSIVEALMDNCLAGSNENNHAKHVKDFTDRMKRIVTQKILHNNFHKAQDLILERESLSLYLNVKTL